MTFDRRSPERTRPVGELLAEPGARMLIVEGDQFAVEGSRLARSPLPASLDAPLFLGREDGAPLFLACSSAPAPFPSPSSLAAPSCSAGASPAPSPEQMLDFRAALAVLEPDEASLLSYARGMLTWAARTKFCAACATPLDPRQAGYSRACPACDAEAYPRLDPAVMILATHDDRILLAQHHGRATAFWSTLAGFVEPGETLEETVARELFEEVGLIAKSIRYYGSQPWPLPASLMIGFIVDAESDTIRIDPSEITAARFYERHELDAITTSSKISLSGQMIAAWRNSQT